MRNRISALLLVVCLVLAGGCKDPTQESLADDAASKMKDIANTLKGVTDESSAKAAAEKIKSISADLKKIKEQSEKLPKPSPEQQKKIREKLESQTMEPTQTIMKETMRIMQDPKLAGPIRDAMKSMSDSMKQ
jgi:hypothetical protein